MLSIRLGRFSASAPDMKALKALLADADLWNNAAELAESLGVLSAPEAKAANAGSVSATPGAQSDRLYRDSYAKQVGERFRISREEKEAWGADVESACKARMEKLGLEMPEAPSAGGTAPSVPATAGISLDPDNLGDEDLDD